MKLENRKYSLLPDITDERDFVFNATRYTVDTLPESVDLRPYLSPIVDQGSLGSCTANAIASGFREYLELKDGQPLTRLSRLFLYYKERELIGTINEDSGAYVRDGMKIMQSIGCSPEAFYPYVESQFTTKPTPEAEANAGAYKIKEYHRITSFIDLQHALAEGSPVVLGMTIFQSFESIGKDGMFPMPKDTEYALGGHAMLACGYKTINGVVHIIVRNSWGEQWGDNGYCYIPSDYFQKTLYVRDMWTGTDKVSLDSITIDKALEIICAKGIFDSPEFWANLVKKYQDDPNSDFRYVGLALRKLAVYIDNNS